MLNLIKLAFLVCALMAYQSSTSALADAQYVGPEKCQNCHKAPFEVWKNSAHSKSYKKVHKHKTAKKNRKGGRRKTDEKISDMRQLPLHDGYQEKEGEARCWAFL
jgi:predicted transposase YbfD/YdcC